MRDNRYKNIKVLEETTKPLFNQRETLVTHTPFQIELIFFNLIKDGDVQGVESMMQKYLKGSSLVYGRMSLNLLTQYKYLSVCTLSTSTHYAILGGIDETDAYNLADKTLLAIDRASDKETILDLVSEFIMDITKKVMDSKYKEHYSPHVVKCIHYIYIHLHEQILLKDLAELTGLSGSYLSTIFKKDVGTTLGTFIMNEKLNAAKTLLLSKNNCSSVGYLFGFCSESHFISCFKKRYGITPKQFMQSQK